MFEAKLKISKEERFLIGALFYPLKKFNKKIDSSNLNFSNLVKIASNHLVLTSLYINLKNKGLLNILPPDLNKYLEQIFQINKNRNKELIREVNFLSELLKKNNINHVFFKGSSNVFNQIYNDIGERMVGDIDILISKNDIKKCSILLEKEKYKSRKREENYEARHLHRKIHKKKLFAIEVHKYIIRNNERLDSNKILDNKIIVNNIFTPSKSDQALINVYNYQINDYGNITLSYSLKNMYDSFLLERIEKFDDCYLINFFNIYGIFDIGSFSVDNRNTYYNFFFVKVNNCKYLKKIYLFVVMPILKLNRFLNTLLNKKNLI